MATCRRKVVSWTRTLQVQRSLPIYQNSLRSLHSSERVFSEVSTSSDTQDEDFRVYEIEGLKPPEERKRWVKFRKPMPPPRFRTMATDQDWTNVWPSAATFKWSTVPFPVRQGFIESSVENEGVVPSKDQKKLETFGQLFSSFHKSSVENEGVVPSKYGNMELMKIPNFLHLTPGHVKKHCDALKALCTEWPEGLETDEKCKQYFPIESVTSDYLFAAPTVKDDRARVASIKFNLSDLDLDYHARDKFIRLVGDRYDRETDEVVFESDRCPLKSQNLDYVNFLLTAVYFESWKLEKWESLKELSDMEKYFWDLNKSRKSLMSLLKTIKDTDEKNDSGKQRLSYLPEDMSDEEQLCNLTEVENYKIAVEDIFNEGENIDTINMYKESVTRLFNLKTNVS